MTCSGMWHAVPYCRVDCWCSSVWNPRCLKQCVYVCVVFVCVCVFDAKQCKVRVVRLVDRLYRIACTCVLKRFEGRASELLQIKATNQSPVCQRSLTWSPTMAKVSALFFTMGLGRMFRARCSIATIVPEIRCNFQLWPSIASNDLCKSSFICHQCLLPLCT